MVSFGFGAGVSSVWGGVSGVWEWGFGCLEFWEFGAAVLSVWGWAFGGLGFRVQ